MKVSGSSIAAYYAGNAALALDQNRDRQAAQQSQAAAQQRLQQFQRPQPLSEQVLEGELLNKAKQQAQLDSEGGESAAQQRSATPPLSTILSTNPAIRHYQTTARLDGTSSNGVVHQLDIYV
jgi:hypothetical protein